jgi:glycosyltransferase involved in cell wall biosynthesis
MSVPLTTVNDWTRQGHIEYLGAADDVRSAIVHCHCVVLPSYREGMPRVLMEAAAMGRPAIATDVTGCRDVVIAGETGLLCEARQADSLARACIDMLQLEHEELQAMAGRAYGLAAERFDDRIVIAIYEEVVAAA